MPKFIVVTGGVVSGLGKGITTASVGLLLKSSGLSVDAVKFDPYLNIDPGTMSPYEHGEVYVLDDGSETDLDLGHYERFLDVNLNKNSSVSSGKIYDAILNQEREGKYLGKNVQMIPNVTNFIQEKFLLGLDKLPQNHVRLMEIGGSTGDMEAEIFLESFRQFKQKFGKDVLHIHLGYIPFLKCSGEYKTKPIQNSNRELLKMGLQPDIIMARYYPERNRKLSQDILNKIALFSNLPEKNIIALPDLESIYTVPVYLKDSNLKEILESFVDTKLNIQLPEFFNKIKDYKKIEKQIKIGIIAKYPKLIDAYLSLAESLKIAAVASDVKLELEFIDAEKISEKNSATFEQTEYEKLKEVQAIIVPGGFGVRGMEGKIKAVEFARKNKIPFLGICLGLQMAVVEFARNVCNLNAFSSEMQENDEKSNNKEYIVDHIPGQKNIHKKGGTMRLGGYNCSLVENTLAKELFQKSTIRERHRHRLEVQEKYIPILEKNGMTISGKHFYKDEKGREKFLVELVELQKNQHPYFIATQSHPEFLSRPNSPHPLFYGLVQAAIKLDPKK
jgi:CTP synthase